MFAYDWGSHEFVEPPFGASDVRQITNPAWRDNRANVGIFDPKIDGFSEGHVLRMFIERDIARVEVRHDAGQWCVMHQGPNIESLCPPVVSHAMSICDERTVDTER